ncbi:MAG: response regulator [Bdellovibrionales bacterium]|nr:response regulator [Bdellovibrionales bacterium]
MSRKILVVDDEPDLCEIVSFHLESAGYKTAIAGSGNSAIEWLKNNPCDLVISDIRMPDGSGLDIFAYISEYRKKIPIIFMSGFSDVHPEELKKKEGVLEVFSKPADLVRTIELIRSYFEQDIEQ